MTPFLSGTCMRNVLVHDYSDIEFGIVWDTVTEDLPPLIAELKKILAAEDWSQT